MSDSFADLWTSSAPIKPAQPPQKLGAATTTRPIPSQPNPHRPQRDAFSILSASQPTSRTESPRIANPIQPQSRTAVPPRSNAATGGDAFSGLFSSTTGSPSSGNTNVVNMTMAERAAISQKARTPQNGGASSRPALVSGVSSSSSSSSSSSAWDGLDSLAQTRSSRFATTTTTSQDDFGFAFGGVQSTKSAEDDDDWGLSEFSSSAPRAQSNSSSSKSPAAPTSISKSQTLWDLDDFASSSPQLPSSRSQTDTPGNFDFGDREDGLLGGDDSDKEEGMGGYGVSQDDDILGDLSKPVNHSSRVSPFSNQSQTPPQLPSRSRTSTASPPPHITGQLVEMGFAPQQSKTALLSTMTTDGFNVQAAADWLLANGEGSTPSPRPNQDKDRDRHRDSRTRTQGATQPRARTTRPPPSRADLQQQSTSQTQPELPASAEKLLSQAGEIGRGMFNRANALWKEGRERAVKMYEERAATGVGGSGAGHVKDGRPRWMQEGVVDEDEERAREVTEKRGPKGGFRDDDGNGEGRVDGRERSRPAPPPRRSPQPPSQPREIDLFANDAPPTAYQSPFRRGKPKPSQTTTTASSVPVSTPTRTPPASHTPAPPRVLTATITNAALLPSTTHKSAGTSAYKLGDFPASLTSYARALEALPDGHVLRVPVLTNRALVKGKLGDLGGVIEDCGIALHLLDGYRAGGGLGSGKVKIIVEDGIGTDPTEVDLIEGLSKAHRRRAEAYEGLEKWEMAKRDWGVLVAAEWTPSGVRGDAVKGVGRCRRIIEGATVPSGSITSKPRPPPAKAGPKPAITRSTTAAADTSALTALRNATSLTAAEDAARHTHKDAVDARLSSWRTGKETNIRALLTTLDVVLWPELGWKKVGMAEVVGKGQVKGVYVRAIGRVHPDKLNVNNTTVEQRMIANGVFGTLNEAWNAFQQQQQ